jgi:HEAT repeat protein
VLLTGISYGQVQDSQLGKLAYGDDKAKVSSAIAKVKSGQFLGTDVEVIVEARAVEAVPILEEEFARSQYSFTKAKIASALIRLGDQDNRYWDYLVELATPAVESDAPNFMNFDLQGKSLPGPSPAFVAWARTHNLDPGLAGEDSVYVLPGKVGFLGLTGDPRAIPLLRRALFSPNYMIEAVAAMGLAKVKDDESIPFIIEACARGPAEAATSIAESLVYFDEPRAQRAVDKYVPANTAKVDREARARGKTPFH